jgi:hypothetical protein
MDRLRSSLVTMLVVVLGSCGTGSSDSGIAPESSTEASCPTGSPGCPCTDGGGCDPGLICQGSVCAEPNNETSETSGTHESTGPLLDVASSSDLPEIGGTCEKVDLLFIVDNSWSMADEQDHLINSVPGFIDELELELADVDSYHLGVISTDTDGYEPNPPPCNVQGGMITETIVQPCGPYAEGYNYMTQMDDLQDTFACAGLLGDDGDGDERPMDNLFSAISGPMREPGACNEGFLRPDALLIIVIISDEEDDFTAAGLFDNPPQSGSFGDPVGWAQAIVGYKGLETNAVVLSLIGTPKPNDCGTLEDPDFQWDGFEGAEISLRLRAFTEHFTYGFVGDICTDDYSGYLSEAISVVSSACDTFEPQG